MRRPSNEKEEELMLLQELQDVQEQTKFALETSWAELERLSAEELTSSTKLAQLEVEWQSRRPRNPAEEEETVIPHLEEEEVARSFPKRNSLLTSAFRKSSLSIKNFANSSVNTDSSSNSSDEELASSPPGAMNASSDEDDDDDDDISFVPFVTNEERQRRRQINESAILFCDSRMTFGSLTSALSHENEEAILSLDTDMKAQLESMEKDKHMILEDLQETLRIKEESMSNMERTTTMQAQTINQLQAELAQLQRQTQLDESNAVADMDAIKQEIAKNEATCKQLELQIQKANQTLESRREEEHALQVELAELTHQVQTAEQQSQSHLQKLESKLERTTKAKEKYQARYNKMQKDTESILSELDLSSDLKKVFQRQFQKLQEQEDALADILVTRMQEREAIAQSLKRIEKMNSQVQKEIGNRVLESQDMFERFLKKQEELAEQDSPIVEDSKQAALFRQKLNQTLAGQQQISQEFESAEEELRKELVLLGFAPPSDEEDEKIEQEIQSLRLSTRKYDETIEILRRQLVQLDHMTKEESRSSSEVINKFQQQINAIVLQVEEKDELIKTLTVTLQQKQNHEAALLADLKTNESISA